MQPSTVTFLSVSLEAWLTVAAIIIGPLAALVIQKYLEGLRAKEDRKVMIFRTLMANRANRLSPAYVQALNGIEVEFHDDTKVIELWRSLIDQYTTPQDVVNDPNNVRWNERVTDRLVLLLIQMGKSLGYDFDDVTIRRNVYNPQGWNTIETEQTKLRQAAVRVFEGERPLKVEITEGP